MKSNLTTPLLVFLGAGFGALARYLLSGFIQGKSGSQFPWGTLVVNVSGSLLIAVVTTWLLLKQGSDDLRLLLVTGVLGGYTTYSAFAYETLQLVQRKHAAEAISYVLATNVLCLAACWSGYELTKRLVSSS